MIKFVVITYSLMTASPATAQNVDAYCEKLQAEGVGFMDLAAPLGDSKLAPVFAKGVKASKTADLVIVDAKKLKMSVKESDLAIYKRDFYNANCTKQIEAQKISASLPPNAYYCEATTAQVADDFLTQNLRNNMTEFYAINTAAIIDIQNEAIDKKMQFEDYAKLVAVRTKAKGKEMVVGKFAEYQYIAAYHRRHCTSEAGLTGRLTTGTNFPDAETEAAINVVVPKATEVKSSTTETPKTGR